MTLINSYPFTTICFSTWYKISRKQIVVKGYKLFPYKAAPTKFFIAKFTTNKKALVICFKIFLKIIKVKCTEIINIMIYVIINKWLESTIHYNQLILLMHLLTKYAKHARTIILLIFLQTKTCQKLALANFTW